MISLMHHYKINRKGEARLAQNESLSDKAYESLKNMAMEADAGEFFSVRKCAAALGLSYTPVREALLRLNSEGLLELIPNVGFFAVRMDMRKIVNIYQSRECVERYVLPLVIEKITQDDLVILRTYIKQQREAMEQSDIVQYTKLDEKFHCYIIDLFQNRLLSDFYRNIRGQYQIGSRKIVKNHSMIPVDEHDTFLDMVEAKEFDKALKVFSDHATAALERMREGFVQIGF